MSTIVEDAEALVGRAQEVKDRFEAARQAVVDWMNEEGSAGRLRTNQQAPGWAAYEAALAEYQQVANALTAARAHNAHPGENV